MRILSFIILLGAVLFFVNFSPGHPHGKGFKVSCSKCHSSKGWHLDKAVYSFDHSSTRLPLTGQHKVTDCRKCHVSLVFSEAKTECINCHRDVHQSTTGSDCARCHTPESWLVKNITEIHQMSRFPLLGAHRLADCSDCHKSESLVRFDVPGINCIDCHRSDYLSTSSPNHAEAGFSEDCSACHPVHSFQWTGAGFNHNFFPLIQGHSVPKCTDCHTTGRYSDASSECNSCHNGDYTSTTNPDHVASNFPTTCGQCHSLAPGWKPATYLLHDSKSFPIYSGRHKGTWNTCSECHPNPSNYSEFTCLSCHAHNKNDMDSAHQGENGYSYNSAACLNCHPRGSGDKK